MKKYVPVIIICGPTASGKSDFAVGLALYVKQSGIRSEIISADSRQVYIGMNIGTGKISKKEMRGVPHHLLDVADPRTTTFTAHDFRTKGIDIITDMIQRNILPIICGGTGFYIDTLLGKTSLSPAPHDLKLRSKKISLEKLVRILSKLDPKRAKKTDLHNPVRVIRAIEVARYEKKYGNKKEKPPYIFCPLYVGLKPTDEVLKEKIHTRLIQRMGKGMINEVKKLHTQGLSYKKMEQFGLEYRYIAQYLQKKISREDMMQTLETEIWRYAKRQMTWFKKNRKIRWYE